MYAIYFFTLIEVLSPFVIQGNLASFLMFRLERFLIYWGVLNNIIYKKVENR